jgi:hypothetical protein
MRQFLTLAFVCALTICLTTPLFAEDFLPPDFRGDPLSYTAFWEFTNDPGPGDIWPDNVFWTGDGVHDLFNADTHTHRDINVVFWDPAGFLYTTDAPGQLAFFLNNWVDPYVFKHIWVQVTYSTQTQPPYISAVEGADSSSQWPDPYIGYFVSRNDVDANHFVEYWQIQPNPNMEYVYLELPPFTTIDEVVIDTWSTDSPVDTEDSSWGNLKALFR